jgi:predicted ATP-dependent serine protease
MTVEIRKAERTKAKLRLGLAGPSGAGKTMSSLKLAKGITPAGRILMIDTERGSGDLYADLFDYDIITLQPPYKPEKYVEAIRAGEEAGYDTIIIDSLSHAWSDEGGILDQADKLSAGGNRFTAWAKLRPSTAR